jgi:glyceraldehyde 3-phosphate dehydrogenase
VVDFVAQLGRKVSTQELREALIQAAQGELKGIMECEEEPLVSSDFKGSFFSSIVDLEFTSVLLENMAKVVAWYDNEWGYSCRVSDLAAYMAEQGL